MAIREPWRVAAGLLYITFDDRSMDLRIDFIRKLKTNGTDIIISMIKKDFNCPLTSSAGRLFDAVSSLCGLGQKASYEAEAAVNLEKAAESGCEEYYHMPVKRTKGGKFVVKLEGLIEAIVADLKKGLSAGIISAKFHNALAHMINDACAALREKSRINTVMLSGGVFQNRYLSEKAGSLLKSCGFLVYGGNNISTTDLNVPVGQALIAGKRSGLCV
jgi:hydrogenase maturation protein HypF